MAVISLRILSIPKGGRAQKRTTICIFLLLMCSAHSQTVPKFVVVFFPEWKVVTNYCAKFMWSLTIMLLVPCIQ